MKSIAQYPLNGSKATNAYDVTTSDHLRCLAVWVLVLKNKIIREAFIRRVSEVWGCFRTVRVWVWLFRLLHWSCQSQLRCFVVSESIVCKVFLLSKFLVALITQIYLSFKGCFKNFPLLQQNLVSCIIGVWFNLCCLFYWFTLLLFKFKLDGCRMCYEIIVILLSKVENSYLAPLNIVWV